MRFPKSKGQTAPTAMPGEFSPWLLLLAASLGWKQAMLWQQAMVSKGFQEKCPQEQDLHWLDIGSKVGNGFQLLLTRIPGLGHRFRDLCNSFLIKPALSTETMNFIHE